MINNGRFNILIPDHIKPPTLVEEAVYGKKANIMTPNGMSNGEVPRDMWEKADAIVTFDRMTYRKEFLPTLKNCKVIVRAGIGYDNIDALEAKKRGSLFVMCRIIA